MRAPALLAASALVLGPARLSAQTLAEGPRAPLSGAVTPGMSAALQPAAPAGGLLQSLSQAILSRGSLPGIPALPTSPQLRLVAPPAPSAPAAVPEALPEAPLPAPAALEPSGVGPQASAPPMGALGPAAAPGRFRPTPLSGGEATPVAASARPAAGLSALGRQAAQTLAEVRALPQTAGGEGAWRLGRRLWEREPRRGTERGTRIADLHELGGRGVAGATPGERAAATAAATGEASPASAQNGAPAPESFEAAARRAAWTLGPASPDVVGRHVASPESVPAPSAAPLAGEAPASPPVPLVALRVAGDALILSERLEPVGVGRAAALAASAAAASWPQGGASGGAAFGSLTPSASSGSRLSRAGTALVSPAPAVAAPVDAFSVAEGAPSPAFDAGDPGPSRVRVPKPVETPAPQRSAQLASAQPWIWLLPMALLAFRYRREYL